MAASIAFVTYSGQPELTEGDRLAAAELQHRHRVRAVAWDAQGVDWSEFDLVVLRSTWNYFLQLPAFQAWLQSLVDQQINLCNPPELVFDNLQKTYLQSIAEAGFNIVPTCWLTAGENADLNHLLVQQEWDKAVVKPVVSGSAHDTWVVTRTAAAQDQARFAQLLEQKALMVQPFVPEINTAGEWSLIYFSGAFSHAVLKQPKADDFRVQAEFGGRTVLCTPPESVLSDASRLLRWLPQLPVYARVDGVVVDGQFQLMELELVEPALFLRYAAHAPRRFAEAIEWALP